MNPAEITITLTPAERDAIIGWAGILSKGYDTYHVDAARRTACGNYFPGPGST
jgi:hypothetical protein